tara:strand:- start:46 stop:822 length:777 start_codon:yes stop_codon:yes gene_type:complete
MHKSIHGFIERKSLLYKSKVEYGDYTINHIQGCSHSCEYPCYAYLMAKRFGRVHSKENWAKPYLVSNYMELLEKEVPKYKERIKWVHLCFTSDPFMYGYPEISNASIEIIKYLNENDIKCTALSKGLLPLELADLSKKNEYGITLISLDEGYRTSNEEGAAPYEERIERLKRLAGKGCKTWVSIEPYPTPNILDQELMPILEKIKFVDKIIFGRTNYNKRITEYKNHKAYYNELSKMVTGFCHNNGIAVHIKKGTIIE